MISLFVFIFDKCGVSVRASPLSACTPSGSQPYAWLCCPTLTQRDKVVIDVSTGQVTAVPQASVDFGGPQHVRQSGSSMLLPQDGTGRVGDVMLVALAAEMGSAMQIFIVDVKCVLNAVADDARVAGENGTAVNCVKGSQPLPDNEPTNLALWLPQMS
jgi:hypothetical protein